MKRKKIYEKNIKDKISKEVFMHNQRLTLMTMACDFFLKEKSILT